MHDRRCWVLHPDRSRGGGQHLRMALTTTGRPHGSAPSCSLQRGHRMGPGHGLAALPITPNRRGMSKPALPPPPPPPPLFPL